MAYQGDTKGSNSRPAYNRTPVSLDLPKGYLEGGYYSNIGGNKRIKSEYIIDYAEDIANKLCTDTKKGMGRSQIYGFYNIVVGALGKALKQQENVGEAIADIQGLISKATNSKTRGNAPELFVKFIQKNATALNDLDDIKAFKIHFEAVMGFYPKPN